MILFGLHMSLSLRKRFFGLHRKYNLKYFYDVNQFKEHNQNISNIKNLGDKANHAEESLLVNKKIDKLGSSLELDNELTD